MPSPRRALQTATLLTLGTAGTLSGYAVDPAIGPRNPPRMAWAMSPFCVQGLAGPCPHFVDASGGDQYAMRLAVYPFPAAGAGLVPAAFTEISAFYTDVEPGPGGKGGRRDILAARSSGLVYDQMTNTCGAGIDRAKPNAHPGELPVTRVLANVPVYDLEVGDLGLGGRMIVAAGHLANDMSLIGVSCGDDPPTWTVRPPDGTSRDGAVGILDVDDAGVRRAFVWTLHSPLTGYDSRVAAPSWVQLADVDNNGTVEILAAFSGEGVVRFRPPASLPDAQVGVVWKPGDFPLPACSAGEPAPGEACLLYADPRLSVDVDLFVAPPAGAGPSPDGAWTDGELILVEALTCATGHTSTENCPQSNPPAATDPRAVLTLRRARDGTRLRGWTLPRGTIPMALAVIDGCGASAAGTSCARGDQTPYVALSSSNTSLSPQPLRAQALGSSRWRPDTFPIPVGWYRDIDPFAPAGKALAAPCGPLTDPAYTRVPARAGANTIAGLGGWTIEAACIGDQLVPRCEDGGAPCIADEPGEHLAWWSGDAPADAALILRWSGPDSLAVTSSFMGPSPLILWKR